MKFWVIGITAVLSLMAMAPERVAARAHGGLASSVQPAETAAN